MAYACPVCEALVPDGEHLAHHLAIVAMSRGGEHEAWLEETVPDWLDREPESLAEETLEHAEEVEHDLVDDPRATDAHSHERPDVGHDHGRPDVGQDRERADVGQDPERPDVGQDRGRPDAVHGGDPDQPADPSGGRADGASSTPAGGEPGGQPFSGGSIQDVEAPFGDADGELSPETAEVLREARELTEERLADAEDDGEQQDGDDQQADGADERATDETDSDE